jgi:hypothetical protein
VTRFQTPRLPDAEGRPTPYTVCRKQVVRKQIEEVEMIAIVFTVILVTFILERFCLDQSRKEVAYDDILRQNML